MARLEDLKVEERAEIESTKYTVNGLCHAVLNDLKKSKEVIKFPQPVMLKAGEIDSLPARGVSDIIQTLHDSGQLLMAVETRFTGELYNVGQFSFQPDGSKFIGVFFVANFIARCKSNGADAAEKIIKKVVSEVVYNDVLMTANGTKRGQVNQVFSSLVGIFIGNRQKSEFGDFPG